MTVFPAAIRAPIAIPGWAAVIWSAQCWKAHRCVNRKRRRRSPLTPRRSKTLTEERQHYLILQALRRQPSILCVKCGFLYLRMCGVLSLGGCLDNGFLLIAGKKYPLYQLISTACCLVRQRGHIASRLI